MDFSAWEKLGSWAIPDPCTEKLHKFFYSTLKLLKAKETIEIGIGRGFGTYVWGTHAKEIGGKHTGIDVAKGPIKKAKIIADAFQLPVDILEYDAKAVVWCKSIDMMFIDGGHTTEQVIAEIEKYAPRVRKNGLIFFHDYYNRRWGVKEAVDKMYDPEKYEQISFIFDSLGLGLWRKK